MNKGISIGILAVFAMGCALADTARLGVLVHDDNTGLPMEGVRVVVALSSKEDGAQ